MRPTTASSRWTTSVRTWADASSTSRGAGPGPTGSASPQTGRTARSTATSSRSGRRLLSLCADVEPYPTYSIVIPIHDEQESLQELQRRLVDVFPLLDGDAEVLFVDDGSADLSYAIMLELHARDPRFKVIHLARNFGHQLAITAGIELARGDAV